MSREELRTLFKSQLPDRSLLLLGLEVLFVPEYESSDEVEKNRRTEGDERKIDKGQSDIACLDAHLVAQPGAYTEGLSLMDCTYVIECFHLILKLLDPRDRSDTSYYHIGLT